MSSSAVGGVSAAAFDQQYSITVAKKSQDAQQAEGKNALKLIEATAPPVKPGHSLSVIG